MHLSMHREYPIVRLSWISFVCRTCWLRLIDNYLNEAHRDNPGTGCAFSALAPEIARSDTKTRAVTSEQVRNDIQLIATLLPGSDKRVARSRASLIFSALVGAMSLARAVSDEALSREILKTMGELLKNSAANQNFRHPNYRRPRILPQFKPVAD